MEAKLSIVLLVPYNRQNDTLIVSYSEDLIRRTTNFLEPVTIYLVSCQPQSLLGCTLEKTRFYKPMLEALCAMARNCYIIDLIEEACVPLCAMLMRLITPHNVIFRNANIQENFDKQKYFLLKNVKCNPHCRNHCTKPYLPSYQLLLIHFCFRISCR